MHGQAKAHFEPSRSGGARLYVHHEPAASTPKGSVLYVHPFAEEMNKSRRMAAMASRSLARQGWAVLQLDLLGCGDSSGESGDARWAHWVDDVCDGWRWLEARHPGTRPWLWGLRAGALLATAASRHLGEAPNLLLWQPMLQGKAVVQQFLRLKLASKLAENGGKGAVAAARADLAAGRSVEVGGYMLHPELAHGLEATSLVPAPASRGQVVWIELSTSEQPQLSPAAHGALQAWRAAGWQAQAEVVTGPAFWQTLEIEDAPELIDASLRALSASTEVPA